MAAWLSGNVYCVISKVTARRAWLVCGWVMVCILVQHSILYLWDGKLNINIQMEYK